MLKTNSRQAKENIKNYILNHFDFSSYRGCEGYEEEPTTYKDICKCIYNTMHIEKRYNNSKNDFETFKDWCQGLPTIIDTDYYYNRSAINDLGDILEQTAEQRNKYTEQQAEETLTRLLYREIVNNK